MDAAQNKAIQSIVCALALYKSDSIVQLDNSIDDWLPALSL